MNTVKTICGDGRLVPGAGATEVEVARQVQSFANTCPGLEQYAITKFGEALEVVPKILAENSGQLATEVLSQLYAAHAKGNAGIGVNVSVSVASKTNTVCSYKRKQLQDDHHHLHAMCLFDAGQRSCRRDQRRHFR